MTGSKLLLGMCCIGSCLNILGCGGGHSVTSTGTGDGIVTPTVLAVAAQNTVALTQPVSLTVSVSGNGGAIVSGTVALSSGSFATFPAPLTNGQASVTIPGGVLVVGTDTINVAFTPATAESAQYTNVSGSTSVTVTTSSTPPPQVSATETFYPTVIHPFKAIPLPTGQVLVSVGGTTASAGIQVFSPSSTGLTATCLNTLSAKLIDDNASSLGMTLFPNGANVALTISDPGVDFFSVANLLSCQATGTGYYVSQGAGSATEGTINAVVTADGKYAFVANEYGVASGAMTPGNIGVVALQYDASGNVTTGSTLVGQISTGGNSIPGLTLSPDGLRLYVMSEIATASAPTAAGGSNPVLTHGGCLQAAGSKPQQNGLLTIVNVNTAETAPGPGAILQTINAGCSPGRAVETADNNILYVAARGDNNVLVFSTAMLENNPGNALLGYASTGGTAPVGLQLFHQQQFLAVANSNRFGTGSPANATILNVTVPESPSLAYTIPTYLFPREFSLTSDDSTLYLTNYGSDMLEVIPTSIH